MARPLRPNTTQVPDIIIDRWMAELSGAEFKVLIYITRRTYGFQKEGDTISLKQIVSGITKRDGQRLDSGTGLNKDTVCKALSSLEKRGLINRQHREDETGDLPNFYSLNLDAEGIEPQQAETEQGSDKSNSSTPPVVKSDAQGVPKNRQGVVGLKDPAPSENPTLQQADLQDPVSQHTATTEVAVVKALTLALLIDIGFSKDAAEEISNHERGTLQNIQQQIEWMALRNASKNWHGLLRRAIEGGWSRPDTDKATLNGSRVKGREQGSQQAMEQVEAQARLAALREIYDEIRLEPTVWNTFLEAVDAQKAIAKQNNIAKKSTVYHQMMDELYVSDEKRLEILEQILRDPDSALASLGYDIPGEQRQTARSSQ